MSRTNLLLFIIFFFTGLLSILVNYSYSLGKLVALLLLSGFLFFVSSQKLRTDKSILIGSGILAFFWTLSTSSQNLHLTSSMSILGIMSTLIFWVFTFYYVLLWLLKLSESPKDNFRSGPRTKQQQKKHKSKLIIRQGLIYSCILALFWSLFLIALFPGSLSTDSYNQWSQANETRILSEWHPLLHTLLIRFVSYIYYSPISFLVLQTLCGSFVVGFCLAFLEKNGLSRNISRIILLVYLVYPINGFYMATLWKDIPFSIALLLFSFCIYQIDKLGRNFLKNKWFSLLFILAIFFTMEFRKNGLIIVLITLFILLLKIRSKDAVVILAASIMMHLVFSFVGSTVLNARESPLTEALAIPTQQVAAVFYNNGVFSSEDKEYFTKILPEEIWKEKYDSKTVDPLKFNSAYNGEFISDNLGEFLKRWFSLLKSNFGIYVQAYLEQVAPLWRYYTPENYQIYLGNNDPTQERGNYQYFTYRTDTTKSFDVQLVQAYQSYFNESKTQGNKNILSFNEYKKRINKSTEALKKPPLFPKFSEITRNFFEFLNDNLQSIIFRGAIGLLGLGIITVLFVINKRSLLIILPMYLNLLTLAISLPATDFRYVFSILFAIPIYFGVALTKK